MREKKHLGFKELFEKAHKDPLYQLWLLLHKEHGLTLMDTELEDIIDLAEKIIIHRNKERSKND